MLPLMLNLEKLNVVLVGKGEKLREREKKLKEAGAVKLSVINFQPKDPIFFAGYDIVMVVGLDEETSKLLYDEAKSAGKLVNVEDKREYCDFFFQSIVRRGKLVIGVSTEGHSPGTAKVIREKIEKDFPEIWGGRIEEIAEQRTKWKADGASYDEVNDKTKEYIETKKWLAS